MRRSPASKIHFYGKQPTPGRKVGHVNMLSQTHQRDEPHDARRARLDRTRKDVAGTAHILVEGEVGA